LPSTKLYSIAVSNEDDPYLAQWLEDLARHAETGEILNVANGGREPPKTPSDRRLPAIALRYLLANPNDNVSPRGLRLRGGYIVGDLVLSHVKFPSPFHLIDCELDEPCDFSDAELAELDLSGTRLSRLNLNRTVINGRVVLEAGFAATAGVTAEGV